MVELAQGTKCSACNTPLSREGESDGLCPGCLLELALDDTSLEAEVLVDPEEAPTLQYSGYTFEEGQIQGERYRVRSLLGRGGMGEVWRAYDLKLRQDVALKALRTELIEDTEALETLRQEVRTAREVISPNVCRVFDLQELDGQELVSMEYIDGTTLQEILKERSPLDLDEAREIASQFLAGLEAIHDAGLVHRDIKPENVMVTRTGRVVVMDFGIAKGLGDGKGGLIAGTPAYMSPEQSRGDELDARADVFSAGVVLAEMVEPEGVHSFEDRQGVWDDIHRDTPDIAETPWSRVIGRCVAGVPEERFVSAAQLARALEEVTLRAAGGEDADPYPGLTFFTQEQSTYFHGREQEVEALWNKLRRPHLLALIAPSGSGKSSFLRAGLLPTLPDNWASILVTPGHRPFAALARALAKALDGEEEVVDQLLQFENPEVAVALVSQWRQQHKHSVIILDQFEELFTQNPPEVQERFAELLGRLPLEADTFVLLSMREDFLYHCQPFESLAPVFTELMPLASLTGNSLRRALVQPALRCGYRFEDDSLVDEMVEEVSHERGALPLLAFAAAQLWERRDRETGLLTRKSYELIGGVGGALAQHAEATLDYVGESNVPIVRELFRNLVTAQGTRAARDREELLSVFSSAEGEPFLEPSRVGSSPAPPPQRPAAKHVLNSLIDARLLTSYEIPADEKGGEPHHRIEIVHESLLTRWPRLVRWQRQDADSAQLRDELRHQARLWDEKSRPEDLLWTDTSYKEFELWRERYPGGLTTAEEAFAWAMTAHAERRQRLRRMAISAVIVLLLAILTVVTWSRYQAVAEARRAEAAKLLAIAQLQLETDPTEALAYTTASLELADTNEARVFALRVLWEGPPALVQDIGAYGGEEPVFSPDESRLALPGRSEEVRVFDEQGGPSLILSGHESQTNHPNRASWASNALLVTGSAATGRARIWSVPGGDLVREVDLGDFAYFKAHADNYLRAEVLDTDAETGDKIYHLRSWRLPDGEMEELGIVDLTALGDDLRVSWFTPDARGWFYSKGSEIYVRPLPIKKAVPDRLIGRHENAVRWTGFPDPLDRLWTRDADTGELRLWNLSEPSGLPLRVISRPFGLEEGVAFSPPDPNGRWIQSLAREVGLWDLEAWPEARPLRLRRSGSWYGSSATIHPRGNWLVAVTLASEHLTFWPLGRLRPWVVDCPSIGSTRVRPLAFSPDGKWLATSWGDNLYDVRLWPLPGNDPKKVRTLPLPTSQAWMTFIFDPQMRFLFPVGGPLDDIDIIPLDGSSPSRLKGLSESSLTFSAAVSPSGSRLAAAPSRNGPWTLRDWDLETGELRLFDLPESTSSSTAGRARGVWFIAFTDEATLYTSGDGGVRRWDLESGTYESVLPASPDFGTRMALAADGRTALVADTRIDDFAEWKSGKLRLLDLATGEMQELPAFGEGFRLFALDASGTVVVTDSSEGRIQVGRVTADAPHLLLGHEGAVERVAISPDGRWVASSGEDGTFRLWPMPDLDKPPLHTLPHDELIAKLQSLTNLRAVRDPTSPTGWSIEVGPFPGWKEVPTW